MNFVETSDLAWVPEMARFEARQNKEWICDFAAVRANTAGPLREDSAREFLTRERSTVVIATVAGQVYGYVVADDDTAGRGGCRGRWVAVEPVDGHPVVDVLRGLLDVLVDRYGSVWGRITNPRLQAVCAQIGQSSPDDPTLFMYRRPTDA